MVDSSTSKVRLPDLHDDLLYSDLPASFGEGNALFEFRTPTAEDIAEEEYDSKIIHEGRLLMSMSPPPPPVHP